MSLVSSDIKSNVIAKQISKAEITDTESFFCQLANRYLCTIHNTILQVQRSVV